MDTRIELELYKRKRSKSIQAWWWLWTTFLLFPNVKVKKTVLVRGNLVTISFFSGLEYTDKFYSQVYVLKYEY